MLNVLCCDKCHFACPAPDSEAELRDIEIARDEGGPGPELTLPTNNHQNITQNYFILKQTVQLIFHRHHELRSKLRVADHFLRSIRDARQGIENISILI